MLDLHLAQPDAEAYFETLRSSHRMRIVVEILDRDEQPIRSLNVAAARVLSGSVQVDNDADITRSLALEFLDPDHQLTFDGSSPLQGALFADNFVAVSRGALVPGVGWVDAPVFCGPVTKMGRDGVRVTIEAQGKETLALDPHFAYQGFTLPKGLRVDDAIRDVLGRIGESRFLLPDLPARLPSARAVEPEDEPWDVVKFGWQATEVRRSGKGKKRRVQRVEVDYRGLIALAGTYDLFYNGRGELVAKPRSRNPVVAMSDETHILTRPSVDYDGLTFRNAVVVTGGSYTQGGRTLVPRAASYLKPSHPLSAQSLARNGRPRWLVDFVEVESAKTNLECAVRADQILSESSQMGGFDLAFSCLPVPVLEEGDTVRVATRDFTLDFRLRRFSIPLTADAAMSVGQ